MTSEDYRFVVECHRIQFSLAMKICEHFKTNVYVFDKTDMFSNMAPKNYNNVNYYYNPDLKTYGVLSKTAQTIFQPFDEPHYMKICKDTGVKGLSPDKRGIFIRYVSESQDS